jgi:hypothetical protein
MTTRIVFDIESDDPEMQELFKPIADDQVLKWRVAMFCCQQQLEKALKAQAVVEHYDTIHMRARATRAARKAKL